ncbi:hypothetical protein JNX00_20700 [Hydrogenophaga sp. YM1]|uniref:helix-turn-helix transcriptional regulator n=1 Tax=Hydrogenophaga sp. YM1 TaxID=2806262 RepID=UPI00195B451A|nr:LuxR family transcriptional regulator [Hydrogenophaga sp. YM1]QRR34016.1 hypothetical protein JNX00_20700 [Hydrogenophaga sp. YM1]
MLDALTIYHPTASHPAPFTRLNALIDGIGNADFWRCLIEFLETIAGGEHCGAWELSENHMLGVGAASQNGSDQACRRLQQYAEPRFWRRDPALAMARQQARDCGPIVVRMDPRQVRDTLIRDQLYGEDRIRERIIMCRLRPHATFGLSVVRGESRGPFSCAQLESLATVADPLLRVLYKHHQIMRTQRSPKPVTKDRLPEIERTLQYADSRLPLREAQLCARLIAGMTLPEIARQLGVGSETVETYRKRAYARLGVSSKQALLVRYLGLH